MDTQSELKGSKAIIAYLSNQFPNCFKIEGEVKPLKIGIFQDIVDRLADNEQFSKTKLRLALRLYTASWRYLYSLKDGANRIDLDGNPCEVITSEQAAHAKEQLNASKEKVKAKRAMENKDKNHSPKSSLNSKPKPKVTKKKQVTTVSSPNNQQNKNQKIDKKYDTSSNVAESNHINQLKVGNIVKILLGSKPLSATISSIEKEHIKVKIPSGMELTVTSNHILL